MKSPMISVIVSSIRPQNWSKFNKWIPCNNTSFEVIFVGHVKPSFKLPLL
jgi:hypothetical protein